ncbi:hypothetical protein CMV_017636 [Castanea mollissima]|uniref:Uncharacterized protein n=1 Tax=Castanea mollissima TaxID=60419 RepID=A0A8J4QSH2_9ROSI|nr:hypothetical protein CMV_017636 [Castanea mollissima]
MLQSFPSPATVSLSTWSSFVSLSVLGFCSARRLRRSQVFNCSIPNIYGNTGHRCYMYRVCIAISVTSTASHALQ